MIRTTGNKVTEGILKDVCFHEKKLTKNSLLTYLFSKKNNKVNKQLMFSRKKCVVYIFFKKVHLVFEFFWKRFK